MIVLALSTMALGQTYSPKPGEKVMRVAIEGRGNLYIRLFTDKAPKTTAHIVSLAKQGFYDGQRFFRVVRQPRPFLVQIGDPQSRTKDLDSEEMGTAGSGARIAFEDSGVLNDKAGIVGLSHREGERDAGDSQFYILLAPSKFLDGNYTVFGQVVAGLDILNRIEKGDRVTAVTILGG